MSDLISRQDTIDRINEYIEEYSEIDSDGNHSEKWCAMQEAKMTIENMPSVQPEKRTDKRTEMHTCDLISRQAAIDAMEGVDWYHINKDGQLTHGANSKEDEPLYKAKDVYKVLNDMPSAQPEQSIAQERYEDLCEYFKDCSDQGRSILNDRKEFKSWLDRVKWHVMECNKLGRELEKLKSAQLEQFTDNEKRIFLAAMTREELICLQIDEKHNDPNLINLVEICHEIIRKVKGALWT